MKITRILNNNVFQALDGGKELVVMGKGIAFGKKVNDEIEKLSADARVYELNNSFASKYINSLLVEVPEKYWQFTYSIVQVIEKELNLKLGINFYFGLLDHIYVAIKRSRDNIKPPNIYMTEARYLYEQEFKLSVRIVGEMNKYFGVKLPDSESGFILMHIIDAISQSGNISDKDVDNIVDSITSNVDNEYSWEIDKKSVYYSRFLVHIKYLAQRIIMKKSSDNKDNFFFPILSSLRKDFKRQYDVVNRISSIIQNKYKYIVSEEEKCYLLIHIVKITTNKGDKNAFI